MIYVKPAFPLLNLVRFLCVGWCSGSSFTFSAMEFSVRLWTTIYLSFCSGGELCSFQCVSIMNGAPTGSLVCLVCIYLHFCWV